MNILRILFLVIIGFGSCFATSENLIMPAPASCERGLDSGIQAIKQGKEPVMLDGLQCSRESKILGWLWYRNNLGNFKKYWNFVQSNPDWPQINRIRIQAELSITSDTSKQQVLQYFSDYPPLTSEGALAYVFAAQTLPKNQHKGIVQKLWHKIDFTKHDEEVFYKAYKSFLAKEDHGKRLNRLIHDGNYYGLKRLKSYVSVHAKQAIDFVMDLLKTKKLSQRQYSKLIDYYKKNPAVLSVIIQNFIKKKNTEDAMVFFRQGFKDRSFSQYPATLRKYRNYFARSAFKENNYQEAFEFLTKNPDPLEEETAFLEYVEGEWFAGWLALKKMENPQQAKKIFERLYHVVKTPVSKAKMSYWLGVTMLQLGNKEKAMEWFKISASYPHIYYGQLSLKKLGLPIVISLESSQAQLDDDDRIFALKILTESGLDNEAEVLFLHLVKTLPLHQAKNLILSSDLLNLGHLAVLGTKFASKGGAILEDRVYPVVSLPKEIKALSPALIFSIIRQESAFNTKSVSYASAKGLMQMMSATAKWLARRYGIKLEAQDLTEKPHINILLGCYYLSELLEKYDGHMVLALAAYNAGPKPVSEWIKAFGDPRDPSVDIVDWVESITFEQTRAYIQRISETLPIYRSKGF